MKKVSVITVNYNSSKLTHALLESLSKVNTDGIILDIIVVDNGSKDKFVASKTENITIVRSEENTGFTGGNNIGIRDAINRDTDYILLINNDTLVDQNMVISLLKALEGKGDIGVVVPKIYFAKGHEYHKSKYKESELGKVLWYAGGFFDWAHAKSVHRGLDEVDQGQYDTPEMVDFATGCCMMLKKETFEQIGLFDDKYFLYYEDADLSERIRAKGFKIHYAPNAILYHENAGSTGGAGNPLQDYFLTRNQMLFGMKYAPIRTKIALVKQSMKFVLTGRKYQRIAIRDYYAHKFGAGTYFNN